MATTVPSQSSAARLWWQLRREGFENVAVLNGGLKAWKAAGLPTTTEPGSCGFVSSR